MAAALQKFSNAMGRTTHKLLTKIGKAEQTHDPEYVAAYERCRTEGKKVKHIARHVEKLCELLHTSTVVMGEIGDEFKFVYGDAALAGSAALAQFNAAVKEAEAARAAMEQQIRAELVGPLDVYHAQYKEMKRRGRILETRKVDMDRYHEKVLKLTEKTTGAKDGLPQADARYRSARDSYDVLRAEMMGDMPKLHADLAPFLTPAIAVFAREQSRFGSSFGDVMRPLGPAVARISTSQLQGWPSVITPPERTAAGAPDTSAATATAPAAAGAAPSAPPAEPLRATPAPRMAAPPPPAASAPAGAQAKALYNFAAEDATELPFKKGETITVIEKQGEWWLGRNASGQQGLFPATYVALM